MPKKPTVRSLIRQRNLLNKNIGLALADTAVRTRAAAAGVTTYDIPAGSEVALRMAKQGVGYALTLNGKTLGYNDAGVYPVILKPGSNGLVWVVAPTKDTWAYQLSLIVAVNGPLQTKDLDHKSGTTSTGSTVNQCVLRQL